MYLTQGTWLIDQTEHNTLVSKACIHAVVADKFIKDITCMCSTHFASYVYISIIYRAPYMVFGFMCTSLYVFIVMITDDYLANRN